MSFLGFRLKKILFEVYANLHETYNSMIFSDGQLAINQSILFPQQTTQHQGAKDEGRNVENTNFLNSQWINYSFW